MQPLPEISPKPTQVVLRPMAQKIVPVIDYDEFPDPPASPKHNLPATIDNLGYLLHLYGITVRFDVLKKRPLIDIPDLRTTGENRDAVVLNFVENLAIKHRMSPGRVG